MKEVINLFIKMKHKKIHLGLFIYNRSKLFNGRDCNDKYERKFKKFLTILSEGSKYQLIRLRTTFTVYSPTPIIYNNKN